MYTSDRWYRRCTYSSNREDLRLSKGDVSRASNIEVTRREFDRAIVFLDKKMIISRYFREYLQQKINGSPLAVTPTKKTMVNGECTGRIFPYNSENFLKI